MNSFSPRHPGERVRPRRDMCAVVEDPTRPLSKSGRLLGNSGLSSDKSAWKVAPGPSAASRG